MINDCFFFDCKDDYLACLITAAFGNPVVPDVNIQKTGSMRNKRIVEYGLQ